MNPKSVSSLQSTVGLIIVSVVLAGCGRDEVKTYQIAKEPDSGQAMSAANLPPGSVGAGMAGTPVLSYSTPAGWDEVPPGQIRVASFSVRSPDGKTADVSVIPLPGAAGGDFANVNRWRGQVGLDPASEDEVRKSAEAVEIAGVPAALYELIGKNPGSGDETGLLAAIQHRDDMAWFFKMSGDAEVIRAQKPAFLEFLKSCKFEVSALASMPAGQQPLDGMSLPDGHPPIGGGMMPPGHPDVGSIPGTTVTTSKEGQPAWEVPANWQETAAGQFLVAKFLIVADGAQAAVNVSASGGDGGGLVANVNRWRKQLGLEEETADAISKGATMLDVQGGKAALVTMSGTDARTGKSSSLVGVMVPQGGQTWYYKLMGDAAAVESQKAAFTKFVQTAKY